MANQTKYDLTTYYKVPKQVKGEIEFIIKDRFGNVVDHIVEPNIVKIFAKEIISHRVPHSRVWDPDANAGLGDWVSSGIDPDGEFAAKYILFGASFDDDGIPLDSNDDRYYLDDAVTGTKVPIRLDVGADFDGGLINAIPLAEPERPLKRIESIDYEATYQPAGSPLLQDDVRAMNNIVLLETTLRSEEYNGFGLTDSDFFTITEVALAAGREFGAVGACECTPEKLFLEGLSGTDGDPSESIPIILSGGDTISIDPSVSDVSTVKEGDQIKIIASGGSSGDEDTLGQVTPYYLVLSKSASGRDLVLDRVPTDADKVPLTGTAGMFRTTLRLFSHKILSTPVKKSIDFEIIVRWRLIFN